VPTVSSSYRRREIEQRYTVDGTHQTMVKLSGEKDPTYPIFRTALEEFLRHVQTSDTATPTSISILSVSRVVVSS